MYTMVTLCNKPLAVLVLLLLSIVTASLIEPDLLETCLKDLHEARVSLIEGGEEALVQTVLEQYNKTGSPEKVSSYVFCFSIPENETDMNDALNWEVRELLCTRTMVLDRQMENGMKTGLMMR
jgi:hypothetical protein